MAECIIGGAGGVPAPLYGDFSTAKGTVIDFGRLPKFIVFFGGSGGSVGYAVNPQLNQEVIFYVGGTGDSKYSVSVKFTATRFQVNSKGGSALETAAYLAFM